MHVRDKAYDEAMERVAETYKPKALDLLRKIRDVCRDGNMATDDEPFDFSADDYRYTLKVWRGPDRTKDEDCIDVSIEIAEEREYEDAEGYGLNFGLTIVGYGGRILGELQPFNFTPEVWVDCRNEDAVAARWEELASANIDAVPALIG